VFLGQVQTEARLINLHPLRPGCRQLNQQVPIYASQRLRDSCLIPSRAVSFSQQRQRDRA
jgi:hypothetical protein